MWCSALLLRLFATALITSTILVAPFLLSLLRRVSTDRVREGGRRRTWRWGSDEGEARRGGVIRECI
jgi:hypothetical protein